MAFCKLQSKSFSITKGVIVLRKYVNLIVVFIVSTLTQRHIVIFLTSLCWLKLLFTVKAYNTVHKHTLILHNYYNLFCKKKSTKGYLSLKDEIRTFMNKSPNGAYWPCTRSTELIKADYHHD